MSQLPARPMANSNVARVLIVDDSAIIRGLVTRWIEAEPNLKLAGVAVNGRDGVKLAGEAQPDVIILDIEMPEMNGLEALPALLKAAPKARVLMSSTLTRRGAEITMKALTLGAADYITKPETGAAAAADFQRDLIAKAIALGRRFQPSSSSAASSGVRLAPPNPSGTPAARPGPSAPPSHLRAPMAVDILVIGSSTGGPQALRSLLPELTGKLRQPILIAQHMPAMFTTILAQHLSQATKKDVQEAKDGAPINPGCIYVAPGDFHMRISKRHGAPRIELDQSPPVNFCRPAVDPLFLSACDAYGPNVLAVVLTGMGSDGKRGAETIVAKGGAVLAQDEATSVVWGMPGAVAHANLAYGIHALKDLAPAIAQLAQGRRN